MKRIRASVGVWAVLLLLSACTGGDSPDTKSGAARGGAPSAAPTTGDAAPVEQGGCEILTQAARDVNQALLTDFAELDKARGEVVLRLAERASSYASRTSDLDLPPAAGSAAQAAQDELERLATEVTAATEDQPFDSARIQAAVSAARDAVVKSVEACSEAE